MGTKELEQWRYPVGRFVAVSEVSAEMMNRWKRTITDFPAKLKKAVAHLSDQELDTAYRPGGWTVRQLVHHCADSHMNAVTRFKLALTEDRPTVKTYEEKLWAEKADYGLPIESSIKMIEGLHHRWAYLLESLAAKDFERSYFHPELGTEVTLKSALGLYDWHCRHHLAHIQLARFYK